MSMTTAAAAAEEKLFGEALSCSLILPVRLRAALNGTTGLFTAAAAEALLHSVAQVEDSHPEEKGSDERGPQELAMQRMEAKLDLLVGLIGRLLASEGGAGAPRPLRWSYCGLCVTLPGAWVEGDSGLLSLPVAGWLPQPLELPVQVLATAAADNGELRLWLAVEPLTHSLAEALKRHIFRQHRRAIAEERRAH